MFLGLGLSIDAPKHNIDSPVNTRLLINGLEDAKEGGVRGTLVKSNYITDLLAIACNSNIYPNSILMKITYSHFEGEGRTGRMQQNWP